MSKTTKSKIAAMRGRQFAAGYYGVCKKRHWPMGTNGVLVSPLCKL